MGTVSILLRLRQGDFPRRSTSWETWIRRGHLRRVITRSASPPPHHSAGSASAVRSAPFPLSPSAPPLHKESHYARWARLGLLRARWAGVRGRPLRCSISSSFSTFTVLFVPIMTPSVCLLRSSLLSSVLCLLSAVCLCLPASLSSRLPSSSQRNCCASQFALVQLVTVRHLPSSPVSARLSFPLSRN